MKVFLGGTCNNSLWREELIPQLQAAGIEWFNPMVENWTPECQEEEVYQRDVCDFCLYVITPKMIGVYSIAEAIDDANKRPEKTIFCYLPEDGKLFFIWAQIKSLDQVGKMVVRNGAAWVDSLEAVVALLESKMYSV